MDAQHLHVGGGGGFNHFYHSVLNQTTCHKPFHVRLKLLIYTKNIMTQLVPDEWNQQNSLGTAAKCPLPLLHHVRATCEGGWVGGSLRTTTVWDHREYVIVEQ